MSYFVGRVPLHSFLCNEPTTLYIQEIIDNYVVEASNKNCIPYILFEDLSEGRSYNKDTIEKLNQIRELIQKYQLPYKIVLDSDFEGYGEKFDAPDLIYLNFYSLMCYYYSIVDTNQTVNIEWNSNANKGLYTPGKLHSYKFRNLLIRKLWEKNALHKISWSYLPSGQSAIDYIRTNIFSDCSDETFKLFLRDCVKSLDIEPINMNVEFNYHGHPYNSKIYENTLYSIITETEKQVGNSFVLKPTEKIYRCIINKHPFILVWHPGGLKRLEYWGFKTFTEYLADPYYNEYEDDDLRLERTIHNIETFSTVCQNVETMNHIRDDVEYNYNLLMHIASEEIKKLDFLFSLNQPHPDSLAKNLENFVTKIACRMGGYNLNQNI